MENPESMENTTKTPDINKFMFTVGNKNIKAPIYRAINIQPTSTINTPREDSILGWARTLVGQATELVYGTRQKSNVTKLQIALFAHGVQLNTNVTRFNNKITGLTHRGVNSRCNTTYIGIPARGINALSSEFTFNNAYRIYLKRLECVDETKFELTLEMKDVFENSNIESTEYLKQLKLFLIFYDQLYLDIKRADPTNPRSWLCNNLTKMCKLEHKRDLLINKYYKVDAVLPDGLKPARVSASAPYGKASGFMIIDGSIKIPLGMADNLTLIIQSFDGFMCNAFTAPTTDPIIGNTYNVYVNGLLFIPTRPLHTHVDITIKTCTLTTTEQGYLYATYDKDDNFLICPVFAWLLSIITRKYPERTLARSLSFNIASLPVNITELFTPNELCTNTYTVLCTITNITLANFMRALNPQPDACLTLIDHSCDGIGGDATNSGLNAAADSATCDPSQSQSCVELYTPRLSIKDRIKLRIAERMQSRSHNPYNPTRSSAPPSWRQLFNRMLTSRKLSNKGGNRRTKRNKKSKRNFRQNT